MSIKYKVVAPIGGRSNKVFDHNAIVTDEDLIEGQAETLVKDGFLKVLEENEKEPEVLEKKQNLIGQAEKQETKKK